MGISLLLGLAALGLVAAAWHRFEGRWDRRLFGREQGANHANVGPGGAARWLAAHPGARVLDVRSRGEFARGALAGAVWVPLAELADSGEVDAWDRAAGLLVYCAGGYRSRKAVELLQARGFANLQHLHRGYGSWRLAGFPVVFPSAPLGRSPGGAP